MAAMSFSMDRGTQTVLSPLRWSLWKMLNPRPPTTEIRASIFSSFKRFNRIIGEVHFLDHVVLH